MGDVSYCHTFLMQVLLTWEGRGRIIMHIKCVDGEAVPALNLLTESFQTVRWEQDRSGEFIPGAAD